MLIYFAGWGRFIIHLRMVTCMMASDICKPVKENYKLGEGLNVR